ncbi:putative catechol O-methyltransferase 1 [Colletotrichum spinosum]|uniref:Putative catechol O-methyltransferase 1 n=1 Tax=Colletotrichum spinosum TaxID=1347390 RepID=A0A4R8QAH1_9PEZI|nr:putative catechol O-methyltransferase 1 [Colletotrichum spinosum]
MPPGPPSTTNSPLLPRRKRRPRKTFSCEPCRISKLRCDRQRPCSTCRRKGLACEYEAGSPRDQERRSPPVSAQSTQPLGSQTATLTDGPIQSSSPRPNAREDEDRSTPSQRWDDMLQRPAPRGYDTSCIQDSSFPLTLGPVMPLAELLELLPSRECCDYLISKYFTHISPLYSVIHGPTFQTQYYDFWTCPTDVSLSGLALLFVVCSLAINTVEPDDPAVTGLLSPANGGEHTTVALSRKFRAACLTCLSQDQFLIRHDLATLESLLVLIYATSHNEGVERGWVLLGSALNIGIATRCSTPEVGNPTRSEAERRRRCWAGILMLYTYQGILFRDMDLSFLLANSAAKSASASGMGQPSDMFLTDFKLRLFRLSNQICGKTSVSTHLDEDSLVRFDEEIAREQSEWDATFLVNGAPSILDTASYAHWCILQTYAHQLYLLIHRPFHRRQSSPFRASSREACLRSSAALIDLHRQFYELPRLRSYRWLVNGMTSFNALQGAAALASCLLDEAGDPRVPEYTDMLVGVVTRVEGLRNASPVCARAFPVLRHLQIHVLERLNEDNLGYQAVDDWLNIDWLNPESYDWDGREQTVVDYILSKKDELSGQPHAILAAIDEWSEDNQILMTVGSRPERGGKVIEAISEAKPRVMVELGGYIGYSTIKFASAVRQAGGLRYISVEFDAHYAELARSLVSLAGLDDFVEVMVGPAAESLVKLAAQNVRIDLLFIDHAEELYASDLKLAEELGLVGAGAWVVADNISGPATREYVYAMEADDDAGDGINKTKTYQSFVSYFLLPTGTKDGIMTSRRL